MRRDASKSGRWRWLSGAALMVLAAVLAFIVSQDSGVASHSFEPEAEVCLNSCPNTAGNSGDNDAIISKFTIPRGDVNFDAVIIFTPPEWGVAADADVEDGTLVGTLHSVATLGLLNGPCDTTLPVDFNMLDATTDTTNSFTYDAVAEPTGVPAFPGYDIMPSGNERGVDEYPDWLNDMFPGLTPRSRSWGHTYIPAADMHIPIQLLVFEPGTSLGDGLPSDPSWGYPSVTVLQDPTTAPGPSMITDFCTILVSDTTTFGDVGGVPNRTNPPYGGTYTFRSYSRGQPDADGDGFENDVDTCPYGPDPNVGDVRGQSGLTGDEGEIDPDLGWESGDGIDASCDPEPYVTCWTDYKDDYPTGTTTDCDGDGYDNRGDNCPFDPNGPEEDNQADEDGDTIGDECDNYPSSIDGALPEVTTETIVEISGPSRPAAGEDTDGDGFDDATEAALGSCYTDDLDGDDCEAQGFAKDVLAADSTPEHTSVAGTCTDEEDNDLDCYIDDIDGGCADDTDGDGVSDEGEEELGSDPEDADSTPEDASICDTCTDGEDNDGDGLTDGDDPGCAAAEGTPTPSPEAEVTPTPEEGTPTPTVAAEYCSPVFPGTYNGLVRIDGQPAASGYEVTASIGGVQWGSALVSGGRYAMDIPDHMPTEPPCFEGGTITFALDDMECTPTADWASGIHNVDLSCAAPPPVTTPTPGVTPTPTATPPPVTPTTVPPTGAGGLSGSSSGLPLWAIALAGCVGLMTVAGLGTLVTAKRR